MIKNTAKFLLVGIFFLASFFLGALQLSAEAAPLVTLKLQVEEPFGSGIYKDTGVVRKTGEKAKYRLYYAISDVDGSTFDSMIAKITFPGATSNLSTPSDFVLPATVNNISTSSSGGNYTVNVNFKSPMSSGTTGTVEFTMNSSYYGGPDGLVMTPTLSMVGTTVKPDTSREPLNVDAGTGPSWEVDAAIAWTTTKTVVAPTGLYVPPEDSYVVEYNISTSRTPSYSSVGSWGETNVKMIDQLPNIPGLTPEFISAKRTDGGASGVYNESTKTITFDTSSSTYAYRVRVKYPKAQVDALGGTALNLTNTAHVESTLTGNVPYVGPNGSVTHNVTPSLAPTKGVLSAYKYASSISEILGAGLEYNALSYSYYTGPTLSNSGGTNYRPQQVEFIDPGMTFTKLDNTTYRPGTDEASFTGVSISSSYLQSVGGTWQFYYRTSDGGSWIAAGTPNTTYVTFPVEATGWRWVVDNPDYAVFGSSSMFYVYTTIKQRPDTMPLLKEVNNDVQATVTYPDSSTLNAIANRVLPVRYDKKIVTRWYGTSITGTYWIRADAGSSLAPGREATIQFDGYVDQTSSTKTNGIFYAALLPAELAYKPNSASVPGPYTLTVTPNFQGTGQTLVRMDLNTVYAALTSTNPMPNFKVIISPTAPLTAYNVPMYLGINSTQANDPSIQHSATGSASYLQTDIYDLDGDGDTTEKIAGIIAPFSLGATNAANVAKLTKGPYDQTWKTDASKVELGDEFQYRIFFRNDSNKTMTHVVLIDVLPRPGDIDPLTNSARNSTWRPELTGPVTAPAGATVYYSTSTTPNMAPVVNNGWSGAWSTSAPGDLATVTAVKIDYGNQQFAPGASADAYLNMKVPNATLSNRDAAKNTVDFSIDELNPDGVTTNPLLPAASGVTSVIFRIPGSTLGDYVWADVNANGIQDAAEVGVNGLLVELYAFDITSSTYLKVADTTTAFHPTTGKAGFYSFDGLRENKYYVKFPSGSGYTLTGKNIGANRAIDSDANATGMTDIFDLLDDVNKTDIDAGYVNLFPVSGVLYYDNDTNGAYASATDWPVPTYTVKLKDSGGTVVQTTATNTLGQYSFMVAGAGNYTIEVDATTLQAAGFVETQPTLDNVNPITTRAIALANTAVIDQNFGFKSANTVKAKVMWDTNANDSVADAVDQPLAGVKVKLWDVTGSRYIGTSVATDATGYVTFTGVFLDRSYRLDIDTADTATQNILRSLNVNINLFNNVAETPLDQQILTGVLTTSGLEGTFGYKSKDGNPSTPPKLTAYTHIDIATLGNYDVTDLAKTGVAVSLVDKVTNITLETGTTDATGIYSFTNGLAEGRAYKVVATTPAGLNIVYNYSGTTRITPIVDTIEVSSYVKPESIIRFGYRSATPVEITGKVVWDTNHNDLLTDVGVDQNLAGVKVNLMSGTTLVGTKTTDANGSVSFSDADGVVTGENYKLVVDKTASGAVMTGLIANVNQLNTVSQTPVDDEILFNNVQNNDAAVFGYKSQDSNPDPDQTAKLNAWGHLDLAALDSYQATDLAQSGISVSLVDVATGLTLQSGVTGADGKFTFINGLAEGRAYRVESVTPVALRVVYNYLNTTSVTPLNTTIQVPNYRKVETLVRYGYRSATPVDLTAKVVWDINANNALTDAGVDQNLAGVKVNLMSGTTVLGAKTTDSAGMVTFTDAEGLVTGQAYKLVVDKTASGAVMTGLIANVNQLNSLNVVPLDDEIIVPIFANHDAAVFGYKSQDSNPGNDPKLTAYTHIDVGTLNAYDAADIAKPGVSVRLIDTATGLILQTATTDATGKYEFINGIAVGRAYQVEVLPVTGLDLVYNYRNTTQISPVAAIISVPSYALNDLVRHGYRSSQPIQATAQVIWDVNHNDSIADTGVDQNLAGVKVKLMSGTTALVTKTTGVDGKVTFTDADGLAVGGDYKVVVDKAASGAVMIGLNANVNQRNTVNQTPVDDEILWTNLQNNDAAVFGYKSQDSNPDPDQTAKLPSWTYLDIAPTNAYNVGDLLRAGVGVTLVDTATGLTLQTGTTDATGNFIFTQGLANGRAYQVQAATPAGLQLVYSYLEGNQVTTAIAISVPNYNKTTSSTRHGYRSAGTVNLTAKVMWDTNHNNSVADASDQVLSGVTVKLYSGTTLIATSVTNTTGDVTFTDAQGVVAGDAYKLVVDKATTGAIMTGLIANVNQLNSLSQAPIDDEIVIASLVNNDAAVFGYKSQDSNPDPDQTAKLTAYTHLDLPVLNAYDTTDLIRAGVGVKLVDVVTGLTLEIATTDSTGKYSFTYGLAVGRAYRVEATPITGLDIVYNYLNTTLTTPLGVVINVPSYVKTDIVRYGYKSTQPVAMTAKVVWDVNHNDSLVDTGDVNLAGVKVNLYSGTILMGTKTTGADGRVSYSEADGIVPGENYKLVVDKVASGAVLTGLNVNVNQLNGANQTPLDDEITITGLANNDAAVFGYKSQNSNPDPDQTAKMTTYTHIDLPVLAAYDTTDLSLPNVSVKLTDTATGAVVQSGSTDSTGKFIFTNGLAVGRNYVVEATTPSGLQVVYSYLNGATVTATSTITVSNYTNLDSTTRFGYRSNQPVSLQGELKWEVVAGTQLALANVPVKLMAGTLTITTKMTDATGKVIFNENDGLVVSGNYKLVVDRTAAGAIMTNLAPLSNQLDGSNQTPVDDEIIVNNLVNGQNGVFVYSKDSTSGNASLTSYTHLDITPVGTYQTTDQVYPGVTVKLKDVATGLTLETGITDSTGKRTFANGIVPGRSYEVEATTPSGIALTYTYVDGIAQTVNTKATVTSLTGDQITRHGYQSSQPITVTTSVILDVNSNNILTDSVDQGIQAVTVYLKYQGNVIATKTTSATGVVSFTEADGLVAGWNYTISLDSTSAALQGLTTTANFMNGNNLSAANTEMTITGVANGNDLKFGYQGNGTISGRVSQDLDGVGPWTAGDAPFSGLTITLVGSNGLTFTTVTDANGQYTFNGLPQGSYTATVTRSSAMDGLETSYDYDDASGTVPSSPDAATITIGGAQSAFTNVDFGYKNKGGIVGNVYEDLRQLGYYTSDDKPLPQVRVDLIAESNGISHQGTTYNSGDVINTVATDTAGTFSFSNLPVNAQYRVQIVPVSGDPIKDKMLPSYDPDKVDPSTPSTTPYSTITNLTTTAPQSGAHLFGYKAASAPGDIQILKKAGVGSARVGDLVPYSITVLNTKGADIVEDIMIKDLIPAGFKYVEGSGRIIRKGTTTKVNPDGNRPITFTLTGESGASRLDKGEQVVISYFLIVGAGIQPGEYVNTATGHNPRGEQISNVSTATVQIVSDPLFDDSLVFGKVFNDKNNDGEQQADEPGLGGVKLITVRGEIITTDKEGRYHIPAVYAGRYDRGANFVLKLDVFSLPDDAKVLSDNPQVVRLTPGVPARVNFRISLPTNGNQTPPAPVVEPEQPK